MQNCAENLNNTLIVVSKLDFHQYGCPHCSEKFHESSGTLSFRKKSVNFFECPSCANAFVSVEKSFSDIFLVDFPNDPNGSNAFYVDKVNNHPYNNIENSCIRSIQSLFEESSEKSL